MFLFLLVICFALSATVLYLAGKDRSLNQEPRPWLNLSGRALAFMPVTAKVTAPEEGYQYYLWAILLLAAGYIWGEVWISIANPRSQTRVEQEPSTE